MGNKKFLGAFILMGMLLVSIGITTFAAGPASFYGYASESRYVYMMENLTRSDKYEKIIINGYDTNWNYKKCITSGARVMPAFGNNCLSVSGKKSYPCAKGIGVIYNGPSTAGGVAASYSLKLRG